MAATREQTQILWEGAAEKLINVTNTWVLSDAFTFDASDWDAELQVWADNQGTPAAGDTALFGIFYSTGDVTGDAVDDYVNQNCNEYLTTLDTYASDEAAADGVLSRVVPLRTGPMAFKIGVYCAQAATRNIKIRGRVLTRRGAMA